MTGCAFANHINEYYSQVLGSKYKAKFGTRAANPDQSKHLETTFIKLNNFEVDLVNLRSESYTEVGMHVYLHYTEQ